MTAIPDSWPGPVAETIPPKISGEKYRRYFEWTSLENMPAALKTKSKLIMVDYPSILRELHISISTDGDYSGDSLTIYLDDNVIFDDWLSGVSLMGYFSRKYDVNSLDDTMTGTITDNLAATATLTDVKKTKNYQTFVKNLPELYSFMETTNKKNGTWNLKLDSYVAKSFQVEIDNVQAAEHDHLEMFYVIDRPIENKYSVPITFP
jgi:hypothetical protein